MNSPIQSSDEFDKYINVNNNVKFINGTNVFSSIVIPFTGVSLASNLAILGMNINNLILS